MDTATPAPVAPAQPAESTTHETVTISAEMEAASRGDFQAFEKADAASRKGSRPDDVEVPSAALATPAKTDGTAAPAPAVKLVSKRQQQINDYERRIAEQAQELETLRARPAAPRQEPQQPAAPVQPAQPVETPQAAHKRFMAMPDAPKLEDFETIAEHSFATATFITQKLGEERAAAEQQQAGQREFIEHERVRFQNFGRQMDEAKAADPEFVAKLTPEVIGLKGFAKAQQLGEPPSPQHFIGEMLFNSPIAKDVMLHFSQQPNALRDMTVMPPHIAAMPPGRARMSAHMSHMKSQFDRLEGRLEALHPTDHTEADAVTPTPPAEARPQPSTVSAAPPPAPILTRAGSSTDPQRSALARNDFESFNRLEQEKMRRSRATA